MSIFPPRRGCRSLLGLGGLKGGQEEVGGNLGVGNGRGGVGNNAVLFVPSHGCKHILGIDRWRHKCVMWEVFRLDAKKGREKPDGRGDRACWIITTQFNCLLWLQWPSTGVLAGVYVIKLNATASVDGVCCDLRLDIYLTASSPTFTPPD